MSEALTIHGHPFSQPSRSVEVYATASGIPHEFHFVDLIKREHLTEEFKLINPNQSVPAITHGDYNLWESAAIVAYLADAFNVDNQWYPKDIKIRGRINAYLHWHHQGCREPVAGYIRVKFFGPKFFGTPELTPETEAPVRAKFDEFFSTFKWILSETGYAARTQEATVADIFAYNEISSTILIGYDFAGQPEVKAWYDKIGACEILTAVNKPIRDYAASLAAPPAEEAHHEEAHHEAPQ